ncbi:MAG TPA: hypothetical protein VL049_14945, partial [Candidatus Dormibacteraeota bacterium]|nr:hypothetical protein [Candidatus Dormibacteraeota bacterium]
DSDQRQPHRHRSSTLRRLASSQLSAAAIPSWFIPHCTVIDPSVPTETPTATSTATAASTATVTATAIVTATATGTVTNTPTASPVPQGGACSTPSQCGTGNCANGVCCDTACDQPLQQCNLPGQVGTCASTAAGAPAMTPWGLFAAAGMLAGIAGLALRRRLLKG